jgi:hypothetical protein
LPGNHNEGAKRDTGQHVQRGCRYPDATIATEPSGPAPNGPTTSSDTPSFDRGGHFAYTTDPDLVVEDVREFFASLA